MPPLPLDERIVVIQRPRHVPLCQGSPQVFQQAPSQLSGTSNGHLQLPKPYPYESLCGSQTLECQRRSSRQQRCKGEQGLRCLPSHCHGNGTVTLAPRPAASHTHSVDIQVSLDAAVKGGSSRGTRGKRVALRADQGHSGSAVAAQQPPPRSYQARQLATSPGGVLQFIPTQAQPPRREERGKERGDSAAPPVANRRSPKVGVAHQSPHSLASVPVPHASILNSAPPAPRHPAQRRDQRPHLLHGVPVSSPFSSWRGRAFPSPDHTCTIDFSGPFGCGCWRLVPCAGLRGRGQQGGAGSPSSSFSCVHAATTRGGPRPSGLSNASTSTTSPCPSPSSSSAASSGQRPVQGCPSCSGPSMAGRRLGGGCLPCAPLSPAGPLRALQRCVGGGCPPRPARPGSSSCSYCSSDPIVVTFDPQRGRRPAGGASDEDDYSVRTIWPEELARKMSHSQAQRKHCGGAGGGGRAGGGAGGGAGGSNNGGVLLLDCQNLQEWPAPRRTPTDHAGRRCLRQGKMAALDFMGSGPGRDEGRNSLQRLLDPRSSSPPSVSPPTSAPSTLIKPRQREREGQSLHLVLHSLNREQDEENSRAHLSLPLSSSLPACLSDESGSTPDAEDAVVSSILPFLFLGNERDAQDLQLLLRLNVGYVVNVTTHLPLYHLASGLVRYKRLPATDSSKQNLRQYFEEVFEFIEEAYQSGQGVLVHCQAGVSRSATVVIAYLMKHTLMTMTDAYKYVRSRRPVVSPNLNFMGQLLEFEWDLNTGVTPRILKPKLSGLETQV